MKTVFLFPGQGSQKAGMLQALDAHDAIVSAIITETEEILGLPFQSLDTADRLQSTQYVQICLLITEVISARRLIKQGISITYVAGHSIGAFSAAVISGVLTFKQALILVNLRGKLMQEAYPENYGMAAMVGFTESRIKKYINEHNETYPAVYLANINAIDQQVIAGQKASLDILIQTLQKAGINRAKMLNMSVPSHCILLDSVSAALKEHIEMLQLDEPQIPYSSNHTGRLLKTAEAIKNDLYISVSHTVKWYDATSLLYELGARCFIEMEPSGVLAKIAESTFPEAIVLAVEPGGTDKVVWLWKNYQQQENR